MSHIQKPTINIHYVKPDFSYISVSATDTEQQIYTEINQGRSEHESSKSSVVLVRSFDENSPASIGDREIHAIVPRITDEELVAEWMSREEKFRNETYAQVQSLFDGIKDSEKLIRELRDEEQRLKISLESMKRSREDDLGPLRRLVEELKLIA